jgi:hypothetical protein
MKRQRVRVASLQNESGLAAVYPRRRLDGKQPERRTGQLSQTCRAGQHLVGRAQGASLCTATRLSQPRAGTELREGPTLGNCPIISVYAESVRGSRSIRTPVFRCRIMIAVNSCNPSLSRRTGRFMEPPCIPTGKPTKQKSSDVQRRVGFPDAANLQP